MKNRQKDTEYYRLYIHGEWVDSNTAGRYLDVQNPANEEIIAHVTDADTSDVQRALESSEKAQTLWQTIAPIKRAAYIIKLADKLKERKEHFARLLVLEQGKTYREALGEVDDTITYMRYAAEGATRMKGDMLPTNTEDNMLLIKRVPYGVTVGLCAWNYPLALIGRKLAPALVTGNTMIVKPHELTPLASVEFFQLIDEVGFPPGVANLITGNGPDVGSLLVSSPITKLVSVTGSVKAGQAIAASAAPNITALTLELGGKAPFIVLEDADIDQAVEAAAISRFANCGQVCICSDMAFVHEKVLDEFTEKLLQRVAHIKLGDPFDDTVTMGPKASKMDVEKIERIVLETVKEGAQIGCGGKRPTGGIFEKGFWYEPTVLLGVTSDMTAATEEIFGPVLPVLKISSFEEAVELTNDSPYGLAAYVFTKDYTKLMKASEVLDVGTVFLNQGITGWVPYGYHSGHKLSGLGGEDGEYGLEGFLQKRSLYLNYAANSCLSTYA